mgnify:CR=1 FL=1
MTAAAQTPRVNVLICEPGAPTGTLFLPYMWAVLKSYHERHGARSEAIEWLAVRFPQDAMETRMEYVNADGSRTPAEAARPPEGETNTATGSEAFVKSLMMRRMEVSRPPGVSSLTTSACALLGMEVARVC